MLSSVGDVARFAGAGSRARGRLADIITQGGGGGISDFDHQVDHILTNAPKEVSLVNSSVTGRHPVNGFWDSDHAGLFSTLLLR